MEVEGIGESKEGEATAVAIARVEIGAMTWRGTNGEYILCGHPA